MKSIGGAIARGALAMAGRRSPWGGGEKGGEDGTGAASGEPVADPASPDNPESGQDGGAPAGETPAQRPRGPRNPWVAGDDGAPPRRSASIEDIFRGRDQRKGGGGGGGGMPRLPQRPDGKSWVPLIAGAVAIVWLGFSTLHMVGPKEQGIVTTFGKYSRTIDPGVSLTLPWPIQNVAVTDVTSIKVYTIPEGEGEKLMLTSDQNLVDLSYVIRWNIDLDFVISEYQSKLASSCKLMILPALEITVHTHPWKPLCYSI